MIAVARASSANERQLTVHLGLAHRSPFFISNVIFRKNKKAKNFGVVVGLNGGKRFPPLGDFQYTSERYLLFMKGKTGERMRFLCQLAAAQQDPDKFMELIHAITRVLEEKQRRLRAREQQKNRQE